MPNIELRGLELLNDPRLNKGTAFTEAERDALALWRTCTRREFLSDVAKAGVAVGTATTALPALATAGSPGPSAATPRSSSSSSTMGASSPASASTR